VNVDTVLADGEIFEFKLDGELALLLLEGGGTGVLPGAGLEGNDDLVLRFGEGWNGEQTKRECGERVAHGGSPINVFLFNVFL
jgi:hypothetical protein